MGALRIRSDSFGFTIILGLLAALPALSLDISVPTLLALKTQFGTTEWLAGLTVTLFMIGFALGQFGAGPLSDRYGRRPVLLWGLGVYTMAGAGCALASGAGGLVGWRFMQGLGAGSCAVMAFAMIRDLFDGDAARAKRSYVTVVFGLAPMLAPGLGALVLRHAGWRPVYVVLALSGLLLLLAVWVGVAESRPVAPIQRGRSPLLQAYGGVLADRRFMGLVAVNALSFGAVFAYIAGSPLMLMGVMGFSAGMYAAFFACTAASLAFGAWMSGQLASAGMAPRRLLRLALPASAGTAVALSGVVVAGSRWLVVAVPLLLLHLFCRGLIAPTAQHLALEPMRENAGAAAAVVGVLQILAGAATSVLVYLLVPVIGPIGMPLVMAVLAAAALGCWARAARKDAATAG